MNQVTEPVEVFSFLAKTQSNAENYLATFPYSQRRRATQRTTLRHFAPLRENSSEGTTDNRQAVKRVARNPCEKCLQKIKAPKARQNMDDFLLSYLRHFDCLGSYFAGIPLTLHRLPIIFRPYRDFFLESQNSRILEL